MSKNLIVLSMLLVGCASAHTEQDFVEIAVSEKPSFPIAVELATLSECQRSEALRAFGHWEASVGATVFVEASGGPVELVSEAFPGSFIAHEGSLDDGALVYVGNGASELVPGYECGWSWSIAHELGKLLGVPAKKEPPLAPTGGIEPHQADHVRMLMEQENEEDVVIP